MEFNYKQIWHNLGESTLPQHYKYIGCALTLSRSMVSSSWSGFSTHTSSIYSQRPQIVHSTFKWTLLSVRTLVCRSDCTVSTPSTYFSQSTNTSTLKHTPNVTLALLFLNFQLKNMTVNINKYLSPKREPLYQSSFSFLQNTHCPDIPSHINYSFVKGSGKGCKVDASAQGRLTRSNPKSYPHFIL